MKIKKTQCVTFPRSGHALLIDMMLKYFSSEVSYPATSIERCMDVSKAGDFYYCEFYNHCRKTPCTDQRTNFQKNHDFDLKLENQPEFAYVIQYRNPLESLVSWYKFEIEIGGVLKDTETNWKEFAEKNIIFWKRFVTKWVLENKNRKTYYLSYYDLVNNCEKKLVNLIEFISPKRMIDLKLIKKIISATKVGFKSRMSCFKYYDAVFFKEIEKKVQKEQSELNLNRYSRET